MARRDGSYFRTRDSNNNNNNWIKLRLFPFVTIRGTKEKKKSTTTIDFIAIRNGPSNNQWPSEEKVLFVFCLDSSHFLSLNTYFYRTRTVFIYIYRERVYTQMRHYSWNCRNSKGNRKREKKKKTRPKKKKTKKKKNGLLEIRRNLEWLLRRPFAWSHRSITGQHPTVEYIAARLASAAACVVFCPLLQPPAIEFTPLIGQTGNRLLVSGGFAKNKNKTIGIHRKTTTAAATDDHEIKSTSQCPSGDKR